MAAHTTKMFLDIPRIALWDWFSFLAFSTGWVLKNVCRGWRHLKRIACWLEQGLSPWDHLTVHSLPRGLGLPNSCRWERHLAAKAKPLVEFTQTETFANSSLRNLLPPIPIVMNVGLLDAFTVHAAQKQGPPAPGEPRLWSSMETLSCRIPSRKKGWQGNKTASQ